MEHKSLPMTASQKQHTRKAFTEEPQRPLTCRVCSRPWHWCAGACDCALLLRTFAVHPPTVFPPGANLPSGQLGNRGQLSSVDSPRNLAPISHHHRWLLCGGWASTDRKAYESESPSLSAQLHGTCRQDWTARHASLSCLEASRLDGLDRVPVQYQKSFLDLGF